MIKRFLKLGFGSWKERRLKGTYLRYYIENPEDGRNILARWLDFLGVIFVTWALSFILLTEITKIQKALLLSAALLVVGLVLTDIIKRGQLKKKILHTRRKLTQESYLEEIGRMEDNQFYNFVINLFKEYGIKTEDDQKQTDCENKPLVATFKESPVWIKFFTAKLPTGASVEEFLKDLAEKDYSVGLIVIKEKATSELKLLVEQYQDNVHVEIIDQSRIAKLSAYLDHPTASSLEENFSELKQHQEKNKRKLLRKELLGTRKKTKGYGISAALLFILFAFWQSSTTLSLIYLAFAMINTALAATSFIMERQKSRAQLLKP